MEALREAVAQHVLVQDADGYAFRHALLQEAAYADLLPGERTALHLALAEALRDDPSLADGHGGGRAGPPLAARRTGCPRRWPPTCARAWRPSRSSPSSRPRQHFERALEIWDLVEDADERSELDLPEVVAHAAHNTHIAGEHHRAVTLGRMAIELADRGRRRRRARRWPASASAATCGSRATATARWPPTATRSRVLPPDPPTPALARVLAAEAQILMLRAPGEETRAACERADRDRARGRRARRSRATRSTASA